MKRGLITAIALTIVTGSCMTQKQPNVSYVFPAAMSEPVKAGYIEMWKKGEILYGLNCGHCHNRVVNRKIIIPEFTEEQLATYEVRIADPRHEMSLSETKVNAEELQLISVFLTYRERDSVALKKLLVAPRDHDHDM